MLERSTTMSSFPVRTFPPRRVDQMPAIPWSAAQQPDPDAEYVVMASRLPLRHFRHIPRFLRATLAIRRQLRTTPGLVGYALDAQLFRKTFWTLSAWTDEDSLQAFVRAEPHHTVMANSPAHGAAGVRVPTALGPGPTSGLGVRARDALRRAESP